MLPSISSLLSTLNPQKHNINEYMVGFVASDNNNQYNEYYEEDYNDYPIEEDLGKNKYIPKQFFSFLELLRDHKQLGSSLVGLGLTLTFIGMMFFFQPTLLRVGNILLLVGIPLVVGPEKVKNFFLQQDRKQVSICITLGVLLVLWGKPRFGILLEVFGLLSTLG